MPSLATLVASAVRIRGRSGAALAVVSGVLDLALVGWLVTVILPLERRTEERLLLSGRLVEQANDAYMAWLVLLAVAGVAAAATGWSSLRAAPANGEGWQADVATRTLKPRNCTVVTA